jgi:hypothetical protein
MKKPLSSVLEKITCAMGISIFASAAACEAMDLSWADVGAGNENWYTSSFYGTFYSSDAYGQWIWHCDHGWQYIAAKSTQNEIYIWDDDSCGWFFTEKDWYPVEYSYDTDAWYYLYGSESYRGLCWDYANDGYTSIYVIGGLGTAEHPFTNEVAVEVFFDVGDSYYVFNDYDFASFGELCVVPDIEVGALSSSNCLTVKNGSDDCLQEVTIGDGDGCDDNSITLTGQGTIWTVGGNITVGGDSSESNSLLLDDRALLKMDRDDEDVTISFGSGDEVGNALYFTDGFLAMKGDATAKIAALLEGSHVWFRDGFFGDWWLSQSADDGITAYYEDSDEGDSAAYAATGYNNLGGYTILSSGNEYPDVGWADITSTSGWWYTSSWYGTFYTDVSYGTTIWHEIHGWQYVDESSTSDAVYLWDAGTASNWYIDPTSYPLIYSYGTGRYYTYVSGTYPNRVFYDWTASTNVSESDMIPVTE